MAAPRPATSTRTLDLPDAAATEALARALAGHARAGDVIALWGDLGAGKTAFARAFINARPDDRNSGKAEEVPSPTFTLVQIYERGAVPVWHFDLYRIARPEEVYELGFEEALDGAIVLIEWPERLGPLLPRDRLDVRLSFTGTNQGARRADLTGQGAWADRLAGIHDLI